MYWTIQLKFVLPGSTLNSTNPSFLVHRVSDLMNLSKLLTEFFLPINKDEKKRGDSKDLPPVYYENEDASEFQRKTDILNAFKQVDGLEDNTNEEGQDLFEVFMKREGIDPVNILFL